MDNPKKAPKATLSVASDTTGTKGGNTQDPAAARPQPVLNPEKFNLAEQVSNRWRCVMPSGTRPEDLHLNPKAFSLVAHLLNEGDDIRCLSADKRLVIDCICVNRAANTALCVVTQCITLPAFAEEEFDRIPAGFEIVRGNADEQDGWIIRRLADGVLLNDSVLIANKEDAIRYLKDHPSVRGNVPQGVFRPVYGY